MALLMYTLHFAAAKLHLGGGEADAAEEGPRLGDVIGSSDFI